MTLMSDDKNFTSVDKLKKDSSSEEDSSDEYSSEEDTSSEEEEEEKTMAKKLNPNAGFQFGSK